MEKVSFVRMEDGTREDYALLHRPDPKAGVRLARALLDELRRAGAEESPYQITRYGHSLQTATRALRGGADEETIVCALLHDVGDALAPANHSELAAAVLRPFVSEANYWMVKHHGIFQGYYYFHHLGFDRDLRERYRGHEHFDRTVEFCHEWDQTSFDPDYDTLPIERFVPLVESLFSRPRSPRA